MTELSIPMQAVIIAMSQFTFVYFRTVNLNATIQKDRVKLMWTGVLSHISWLISSAIGINAVIQGNVVLIIVSIVTSVIAADFGLTERLKISRWQLV